MKIRRKPFKNLYQQEYFVYITLIISIYQRGCVKIELHPKSWTG